MINLDYFFALRIEEAGSEMTVTPRVNNQLEAISPIVVWSVSEEANIEAEGLIRSQHFGELVLR